MYREVLKCVAEITDYPYSIEKWEAKETVKTSKEMIKQIGIVAQLSRQKSKIFIMN